MPSKYGAHVSAAGGVFEAVARSAATKGTAFALFVKNQNRFSAKPYTPEVIDQFRENCKILGYDPRTDTLPHGSYLINLANPDPEKWHKSYATFEDDLRRCEQLNIGLYNFHPGSSLGSDRATAIASIAKGINLAHKQTKFVKVVLENMTGNEDRIIGTRLEDLSSIIEQVEDKDRVGVCIDTCHTFAAGFDIRTESVFNKFWSKFDDLIGYRFLAGIHLNDSKGPLDSKLDRHQSIGLGFLGLEAFRLVMNKPELIEVPKILETPLADDKDENRVEEIELLKWLIGKNQDDLDVTEKSKVLAEKGASERKAFETKASKKAVKRKKQVTFEPSRKAAKSES